MGPDSPWDVPKPPESDPWGGPGSIGPRPQDPFEIELAKTSREFQTYARQARNALSARDNLETAMSAISAPTLTLDERAQKLVDLGLSASGIEDIKKQITGGTISFASLQTQANAIATGLQTDYDRLTSLDPLATSSLFPQAMADSGRLKFARTVLGGDGSGGGAAQAPQYSFQIGAHGEIVRMGSNGSFEIVKTMPELAGKQVHIQTDEMSGKAYALTLDADGNVTSRTFIGQQAYPAIDPERKFRFDVLTAAANVEQSMAGIEISRRGQVVQALGQDMANQVSIGNLEINEAQVNLARIDSAFNQQRADREQMLKYAVVNSSLRTLPNGQVVTQLPFSDQLAGILSAATGRTFSPSDFQLGVTAINPEQTGRDVLASSSFTDPVPGLRTSLQSTRDSLSGILGASLPDQPASKAVVGAAAVPGVR